MFAALYQAFFAESKKPLVIPASKETIVAKDRPEKNCHQLANTFMESAAKQYMSMFEDAQFTLIVLNVGLEFIAASRLGLPDNAQMVKTSILKDNKNITTMDVDGVVTTVDTHKSNLAKSIVSSVKNKNNPAIIFFRAADSILADAELKKLIMDLLNSFGKCLIGIEYTKKSSPSFFTINSVMGFFGESGMEELESGTAEKLAKTQKAFKDNITPDMQNFIVATYKK